MAVKIEIVGDSDTALVDNRTEPRLIVVSQGPVAVTGNQSESVAISVLKGLPGDQRVYTGTTPPNNPQEGWVWIDTS